MSVRNLEALFQPSSVAVIGASDRAGSVGFTRVVLTAPAPIGVGPAFEDLVSESRRS